MNAHLMACSCTALHCAALADWTNTFEDRACKESELNINLIDLFRSEYALQFYASMIVNAHLICVNPSIFFVFVVFVYCHIGRRLGLWKLSDGVR